MERANIRVNDADGVVGSDVPCLTYGDPSQGPTVSIFAGVHGCEYTPMRALQKFIDELDESRLRGSLRIVPIANLASFHSRTAFVVPHDGKNLNRCFPGDPGGTFTDRLAAALFEGVVRGADFHIDMHAGDQVEDLAPFAIYDVSTVTEASQLLAHAYGLDYVVRTERGDSPIAGTSSAAAAEVGIPAITAEVGGRGLVDESSVARHLEGLRRTLSAVGVLPDVFPEVAAPREVGRWVWLRATFEGWWQCGVEVGQEVTAGARLGSVRRHGSSDSDVIVAPVTGVPLFVTTSPAVSSDGLLMGFAVL
jgi:predicted deacylase